MKDHARFRAPYAALEVLELFPEDRECIRILDVGGGNGVHTNFFRKAGFEVDLVDIEAGNPERVYVGDFLNFTPSCNYDVVWASHALEHVPNPGAFIKQLIYCTKENGIICITVPPFKNEMTFEHMTLWNAGLLLINLIKAGVDCRRARILTYGYNISIIVKNEYRTDNNFAAYLPNEVVYKEGYFEGQIDQLNWQVTTIPTSMRLKEVEGSTVDEIYEYLQDSSENGFVLVRKANNLGPRFYWWDATFKRLVIVS